MNLLNVTYKDLQVFVRDRGSMFTLFLLPFVFILVLSLAMQGMKLGETPSTTGPAALPLTVVNNDPQGQAAQNFLAALKAGGKVNIVLEDQAKVEDRMTDAALRYALFIPADFSTQIAASQQTTLRLAVHPINDQVDVQTVERAVARASREYMISEYLNAGLEQMAAMQAADPNADTVFSKERIQQQVAAQGVAAAEHPLIKVVTTAPAKPGDEMKAALSIPTYSEFAVVGMTVLFVFMAAQLTARSIFDEKREGTFRRLLASPISKPALLGGKLLPNFILVLIQIAVLFFTGGVLIGLIGFKPLGFNVDWTTLIIVSLAAALCSTSLGIFIAALAKTEAQIGAFSSIALFLAGMLGGSFVPLFLFPEGLEQLARVVPLYWANQAYFGLFFRGQSLVELLPNVAVLLGFSALFFGVGLWRFKFN
jgi:ABC-2 type transport system permease protein